MNTENLIIREISAEDNKGVEELIKTVMPEFGASGPGFAINDPEVSNMYEAYHRDGHVYFVISQNGKILGGAGVAPLTGLESTTCELRKMYFKEEIRGLGLGQRLMSLCLVKAKELGYSQCYIETLENMKSARKLYEKNGFTPLKGPMGNTGHFSCDRFYIKKL